MAVLTGVYEDLVASIGKLNRPRLWGEQVPILGPVFAGVTVGILGFSKLILVSLELVPEPTGLLFVGLVAGGIPFLWKLLKSSNPGVRAWIGLIVSLLIVASFSFITAPDKNSLEIITDRSWPFLVIMFFAGMVSASAMVVPGISGSFLLIMLGYYTTVFSSVVSLDFLLLVPFGLGAVLGIWIASRLMSWLFKKVPDLAYGVIFGLVLGSLFPLLQKSFLATSQTTTRATLGDWTLLVDIVAVLLGVLLGFFLGNRPEKQKNIPEDKQN